jgi:poly(U)-specific endoribonuclease
LTRGTAVVWQVETFKRFADLLDNYSREVGVTEVVTSEERAENMLFLQAVMRTAPMQYVHKYLVAKHLAPADPAAFIAKLNDLWFKLYRR